MSGMLVVTTDQVPGYRISAVMGEVVGVTARTHNPFSEGVKGMDGKPNPHLGIALLRWRKDAVGKMIEAAVAMGANAIVGMRFDNRWITQMVSEICAYGTAVQVSLVPEATPQPPAAQPAGPPEPLPVVPPGPAPRHARPDDDVAVTVVNGTPVPAEPEAPAPLPAEPPTPLPAAPEPPAPEPPASQSPAPLPSAPEPTASPSPASPSPAQRLRSRPRPRPSPLPR